MFSLDSVQQALQQFGFDGWLLFDFRASNVLARRVLGMGEMPVGSRRFFYFIPATGTPQKLVHRIEMGALDHLPGEKNVYLKWQELEAGIAKLLNGCNTVAMEYSPRVSNPYVSKVDAGTIEMVRSLGVSVVSSGDLIQLFEATWDDDQIRMHFEAEKVTNSAYEVAWKFIADEVRSRGQTNEPAVRDVIMAHFAKHGLTTYHPPIVGVGPNSGDPHYETGTGSNTIIRSSDFVLIDLWAKLNQPRAVYSDLTRTGFVGESVPEHFTKVFRIVANARDAAIACVRAAFNAQRPLRGWEVDQACRDVVVAAGYGDSFVHRTGHSIGQEVHGNGANIDNLETHEERLLLPRTCFSIEPGIYLPEFGVRSEVDVLIGPTGEIHVTGGDLQTEIVPILARTLRLNDLTAGVTRLL